MDPELYVFPKIEQPALKIAASTLLFLLVIAAARLLPRAGIWAEAGGNWAAWLAYGLGYGLFIYSSYLAWRAAREKNTVEDPKTERATRLLDSGAYARTRHPMYGMFILANAGLGLASQSAYGLGFSLLSLLAYVLNGIFEERTFLIPRFGEAYRDYMRRVPARYFTPAQTALLALALLLNISGLLLG